MAEAYRLLKTGGKLLVIEWNDKVSPIGPEISSRVSEMEVNKFASKASFKSAGTVNVDAYHYGLMYIK
jgi:hypothetical protein